MRKFQRAEEPVCLNGRWEQWGVEWEARLAENKNSAFHWHQVDGTAVNHHLLPSLLEQTQQHCSFCDLYPASPPSIPTIEHFRPKRQFPRMAYAWVNLFFCCTYCQQKNDFFDECLIAPDEAEYDFERYFRWDYTRGTLEVNTCATAEDQKRARTTIDAYHLNDGHPPLRRRELLKRAKDQNGDINDFAYRGFIDGPSNLNDEGCL